MIDVNFVYLKEYDIFEELLTDVINKAAEIENITSSVSVVFMDNEGIKEYNNKYRNINNETDVLSFPSDEEDQLGDILVSIEKAKYQATEFGHSFKRELCFLVTHGFLHLLGFTHYDDDNEKKMMSKQKEILSFFKIERDK